MEDTTNRIHHTAFVSPFATIGKGNIIGPGVIIEDNVIIGDNNFIGAYSTIGLPGEYRDKGIKPTDDLVVIAPANGKVEIGNRNVIREYVAIQSPVLSDLTKIGDDCFIMNKVHVGHDVQVGNFCTIAPLCCLGGSVILHERVNMGMGAKVHPRITVYKGAMIGINSTITKIVHEWRTVVGIDRVIGINKRGMEKAGMSPEAIELLTKNLCAE